MEKTRSAECFLTVEPGNRSNKADIVRMTKGMPHAVPGSAIVIKLNLELPDRAFRPPVFEALVDVPEDYVGRIIVQAADPAPPKEPE